MTQLARTIAIAASALLWWDATAPSPAHAQEAVVLGSLVSEPPLRIGSVVRVRQGPRRSVGRLADARGDTIQLRFGPGGLVRQRVVLTARTDLDTRVGRASRWRGAALGTVAGAATGLLLGATIVHAFSGESSDIGPAATVFLPYTVPAGALLGALFPGARWQRVRLTPPD